LVCGFFVGFWLGVLKKARVALVIRVKQQPPQHMVIMMRTNVTMMESSSASEE
jgi:hypothetical protein